MCKVSNKIKFCTCENQFPLHLTHYWQIKKRIKGTQVIGSTHFNNLNHDLLVFNENAILNRLKENDCFDFDYNPEIDDKLNVSFLIDEKENERMEFNFVYTENGWTAKIGGGIETMEWMLDEAEGKHQYAVVKSGKIKNEFK